MSMLKMQKINIFALKKHRKDILETLQRKGVIEITDNILEDNVFYKEKTSSQQVSFLKSSQVASIAKIKVLYYLHLKAESLFLKRTIILL